ncbi:tRNA glutamyl-Q(34) synthetase GluQRS [Neogemmobacter tilapiae]|uniref:tRNA glutamyl-Q synthetase n=1 Tax=Neogemmobacter tilapiae TaxID=875041 RepID=A0A918WMF2_9RHOB|nr:tRNA glutamyl-Q(34) synthetase GluQRS [Gemmobacter tilapiae]GHC63748.1 tRNA glutamyl-Q synthetase [Gemmobacter tilapiae]
MAVVTRFAPSPTGPLHLGHAYAAFVAHDLARAHGGQFLLRIEDIDRARSRPEWEAAILDDLAWLGMLPDGVMRQSDRLAEYDRALDHLWARGLLYPCRCTRRDIEEALNAPQEGINYGPDGPIYPGTCRDKDWNGIQHHSFSNFARPCDVPLRLDMAHAAAIACEHHIRETGGVWDTEFMETGGGRSGRFVQTSRDVYSHSIGDIVLARRDMGTSYHLSVVIDDAAQGVTHVTRGEDLFEATRIHVLLQRLLNLPTPVYHHHRLIRDDQGKRLAKRDDARALAKYRAEGATPGDIRRMIGL